MNNFINKLITAVILIILPFNTIASGQCDEEAREIIKMQEKSLNHGTVGRSTTMAYVRITVGASGIIYALVNSATGIGLLSALVLVGGSLDIYLNSKNAKVLDKLEERLCT
jgi:hypothetical protein